ncbi:monocarboxylate transporter 12 [Parasteatoda tepidariorum]|uniref:monocarboxylate transporter 12 n=1 Tax=Parasteatoda tepidariorum TaxID=114398 RepID=UPI001C71848C|nr:uncharacterized protein LOC107446241 [Parasteatoda tepidariorum]
MIGFCYRVISYTQMEKTGYNSWTSWLTVIACSIVVFFVGVPMRLSGLFFVILLDGYDTDRQKASMPIVIFGVLRTLTGPFTAFLGETFGIKVVILAGSIFTAVGIGSCFFAEDINTATICIGFIYGFGLAFGCTLVPSILKLHFTEHINLVNGIWLTGSCMGAVVMSPVITSLQSAYGTNGMFLLIGGIFLNCIPAAILLEDPHNDRRKCKIEENYLADNSQITTYHQNPTFVSDEKNLAAETVIQSPVDSFQSKKNYGTSKKAEDIIHGSCAKESVVLVEKNNKNYNYVFMELNGIDSTYDCPHKILSNQADFPVSQNIKLTKYTKRQLSFKEFENSLSSDGNDMKKVIQPDETKIAIKSKNKFSWNSFRLFIDPTFHFIMIVQSIHAFVTTLNWTIIVDYGRDKGISIEKSVYFSMVIPFAEMFGNMCLNWITDGHFMTRTNFILTCFLILVLDAGYIIWTYDFLLMMIGVLVFGFITGAVATTFPGIIMEQIEEEQQNMALASRFSLYAFLCVLKTPIIGFCRETLGSYGWVYCIIMASSFTCCIVVKLTPVLALCRNNAKQLNENA